MEAPITSNEDLRLLIEEGQYFAFCCGIAFNKGLGETLKDRKECEFTVGDYEIKFIPRPFYFQINHKEYFMRMILAHPASVHFIGEDESEVISDLLTEFDKEIVTNKTKP